MPTTYQKYIEYCKKLFSAKPRYEKGMSTLTACDCIGMPKYAFRAAGVTLTTTGTNYSARHQVDGLRRIESAADLVPGMIVFKARGPESPKYALPGKYRQGGADYTGDLLDYYHIGTVAATDGGLRILHMTSPTAAVDHDWRKWTHCARWKPRYISNYDAPAPDPAAVDPVLPGVDHGIVTAPTGRNVNMRKEASLKSAIIARVPIGTTVAIVDTSEDWARVQYGGKTGYMQNRFLSSAAPAPEGYTVTVRGLTKSQADGLCGDFPGAVVSGGKEV
jgi:hypothetical protein